jgi:hypothetical protein
MNQSPQSQNLEIQYPIPIRLERKDIADLAKANQGKSLLGSQAGVSTRTDLKTHYSGFPTL